MITHMQGKPQVWYPTIQAMLGKLYVLSLYFTLYAPAFFGKTLSWGSVCLINALWGRNNRMDLTSEPPTTFVTTMDGASLDSMGSPTQRYVLTLPFAERSEQRC